MVQSRDNRQLRAKRRKRQDARLASASTTQPAEKTKVPAKGPQKAKSADRN